MKTVLLFYPRLLKANWRWLVLSGCVFVVGLAMGCVVYTLFPDMVNKLLENSFSSLSQIALELEKLSFLQQVWMILRQNVIVVSIMLITGVFFGVFPFLLLFSNSFFIGVLGGISVGKMSSELFFSALAPHAFFELPALFIVAAWGMKLGHRTFLLVTSPFRQKQKYKNIGAEWQNTFNECGYIWLLVVLLLIVAAFIEIGVSYRLVQGAVNTGL
ncbi:MAG: stage II sporulation protein M [bacterium]